MEPLSTRDVLGATRGQPAGAWPESLAGVSTDTRSLRPGELFFALRGEQFDGHRFLAAAHERGAAAAVVDHEMAGPAPLPLLRVKDTTRALLDLAAWHRRRLTAKVIAITGSNGKTTTKDLTARALEARHSVVRSPRSFNNFIGVPLTLFLADSTTEMVVLELGTSSPGEIATLAAVVRPDAAAITNVAAAHLEGLGSLEGVLAEKGALLDHVAAGGFAVLNGDDDRSVAALRARARCRVVQVGVRRRADYTATMPVCDLERIAFHLNGRETVRVPLLGCHNLYNALVALALACELGVPPAAAALQLRAFEGPPGRLKKHKRGDGLVIDDAYNANPGSMIAAVQTFAAVDVPGRKVLVLGDMLELGEAAPRMHREVGTALSCGRFDLVVGVGPMAEALLDGAREKGFDEAQLVHYGSAEACARELPSRLLPDDAVLLKGSRKMGLEKVSAALLRGTGAGRRDGEERDDER